MEQILTWQQIYDPFSNIWLSALVAFLPILCFLVCLVVLKLKGYQAGFLTVILATLVALFAYKMPWNLVGASFYSRLYKWYVAYSLDYHRGNLSLQTFYQVRFF